MNIEDLKSKQIVFRDATEMIDIAKFLVEHGYKVYNYDHIINSKDTNHYKRFTFSNGNYFTRGGHHALDKVYVEDLKNIKPLKRKMNFDDDPYGEDNWGFVQENIDYINLKKCRIVFRNAKEMKSIAKYLAGIGYKITKFDIIMESDDDSTISPWTNFIYDEDHFVRNRRDINDMDGEILFIEDLIRPPKKRIMNPNDDPFGEENYGFIKENMGIKDLKDCRIIFRDAVEMKLIAKFLHDNGHEVYHYNYIMRVDNNSIISRWTNFIHNKRYFVRNESSIELIKYPIYIEDIKNIKDVKLPKIPERKFNLEDDPFGEENYGFIKEGSISSTIISDGIIIPFKNRDEFDMLMRFFEDNTNLRWEHYSPTQIKIDDGSLMRFPYIIINKQIIYRADNSSRYINKGYKPVDIKDVIKGKLKKVINLEDDPFGEENYGYIQENVHNLDEFQVDDIVIINPNFTPTDAIDLQYIKKSDGGSGKIVRIRPDRSSYPIDVLWNNDNRGAYKPSELLKIKSKRVFNLEDDPLGEENYGYIQENWNSQIKVGDRVLFLDEDDEDLNNQPATVIYKDDDDDEHGDLHYLIEFDENFGLHSGDDRGKLGHCYWVETIQMMKIGAKRIFNLEDDPLGEENYGFLEESINEYADLIPSLKHMSIQFNSVEEMKEIAKLIHDAGFEVFNYDRIMNSDTLRQEMDPLRNWTHYSAFTNRMGRAGGNYFSSSTLSIDELKDILKSLKISKKKRIVNLEDDPFGEENYGFVQESLHKFEIGDRVMGKDCSQSRSLRVFGKVGTIIKNNGFEYGVEFDEYNGGHDCSSLGKSGHCWFMATSSLMYAKDNERIYNPDDPFGEDG